jgi:hypothetical protein
MCLQGPILLFSFYMNLFLGRGEAKQDIFCSWNLISDSRRGVFRCGHRQSRGLSTAFSEPHDPLFTERGVEKLLSGLRGCTHSDCKSSPTAYKVAAFSPGGRRPRPAGPIDLSAPSKGPGELASW